MALQSSGAISISEIGAELNQGTGQTISLYQAERGTYEAINSASASKPNGVNPHSMSEWYSYDHNATSVTASDYYWQGDGVNDTLRFTNHSSTLFQASMTQDFSYSGWFRIDETTNQNQFLGTFCEASPSGNNMIFIMYNATSARLQFRYRKGGGGNFHQKFWSMYSTNNASITGVSSAGWKSNNRGNVNSDNFVMLTFTYDASNRASSGMNVYWNGTKLPDHIQFNSRSLAAFDVRSVAIGDAVSASPNNSQVFQGGIDQVSCYSKLLSQSEITSLYNSGTPMTCSDAGVTSSLMAEYRLENNTTNTSGTFPSLTNTGGVFQTY